MIVAVAGGCAARRGIYHQVGPGENLFRIGKAYGISYQKLGRINKIRDPHRIKVGQRIFIPRATRQLPVRVITPEQARYDRPDPRDWPKGKSPFIWPVTQGTLTSRFGPRGDSFHDGIDIGAPKGALIRAARSGEVLYDDKLRGYGNVIILRHNDDYATVYAHNSAHLVRVGNRVRQGQPIARLGDSGRTSGPNLHFEIRKKNVARNPLYYLPRRGAPAGVAGRK
jgi:murein DD-endopeptidase MepM/ murein hydrolase activator NlpD